MKDEHKRYIETRKAKTSGVKICQKCGGVIWHIGFEICGDCREKGAVNERLEKDKILPSK